MKSILPYHEKRTLTLLAVLFILTLTLRLLVIWNSSEAPSKDALQYHQIATHLLAGKGFSIDGASPTRLRPPAYPLFLAGVYAATGTDYRHALYAQALMHSLLVFPLFWLAIRISGIRMVGWLTIILFLIHTSFEIVGKLYSENLLIALGVGFVAAGFALFQKETGHYLAALCAGLLAGLMGLTKPEFSLLGVAFMLMGLIIPQLKERRRQLLLAALISLLLVGGWQLRNALVTFSEGESIAETTLLRAYYPAFVGTWWWSVTDMEKLEEEREESKRYFEKHHVSRHLRKELAEKVMANPLGILKLILSRGLILWFSPPVGSSALGKVSPFLKWAALILQYGFVILALVTLGKRICEKPGLMSFAILAVYLTVVYGLIHAIRRYGYVFVPELCLLAAMWFGCFGDRRCSRRGEKNG